MEYLIVNLLDELLRDYMQPGDIIGEHGLLTQVNENYIKNKTLSRKSELSEVVEVFQV